MIKDDQVFTHFYQCLDTECVSNLVTSSLYFILGFECIWSVATMRCMGHIAQPVQFWFDCWFGVRVGDGTKWTICMHWITAGCTRSEQQVVGEFHSKCVPQMNFTQLVSVCLAYKSATPFYWEFSVCLLLDSNACSAIRILSMFLEEIWKIYVIY